MVWYHPIGDMASFMLFMNSWSGATLGSDMHAPSMILDRVEYLQGAFEDNGAGNAYVRHIDDDALAAFGAYMQTEAAHQRKLQFFFTEDELRRMKRAYALESGAPVSVNDALCGHMYSLIESVDPLEHERLLGIVVNYRPRVGLPAEAFGNMFTTVRIRKQVGQTGPQLAAAFRDQITHFAERHMDYYATERYIAERGGLPNIDRFTFSVLDPVEGALVATSWTNFDVYEPDFGGGKPFYVTQYATLPFPGLLCVTEGFDNKGLIFTAPLPTRVADALMTPSSLAKVHQFREPGDELPAIVERLGWLG